jgi:hypothetical protein
VWAGKGREGKGREGKGREGNDSNSRVSRNKRLRKLRSFSIRNDFPSNLFSGWQRDAAPVSDCAAELGNGILADVSTANLVWIIRPVPDTANRLPNLGRNVDGIESPNWIRTVSTSSVRALDSRSQRIYDVLSTSV